MVRYSLPSSQYPLVEDSISVSTTLKRTGCPVAGPVCWSISTLVLVLTSETWRPSDFHSNPKHAPLGILNQKRNLYHANPSRPKDQTLFYAHGCLKSMTGSRNRGQLLPSQFHIDLHLSFQPSSPRWHHTHYTKRQQAFWCPGLSVYCFPRGMLPLLGVTHNLYTPITVSLRVLHSPYVLSTSTCSLLLALLILSSYRASASLMLPRFLRGVPNSCLPAQPFSLLPSPSRHILLLPFFLSSAALSPTSSLKNWLWENGQLSDSPCAPTQARSHTLHTTTQFR